MKITVDLDYENVKYIGNMFPGSLFIDFDPDRVFIRTDVIYVSGDYVTCVNVRTGELKNFKPSDKRVVAKQKPIK